MTFNFALRATYHIDRTDPDDEIVELLHLDCLIDSANGLTLGDLTPSIEEDVFGLGSTIHRINGLPTGVHKVWAVGTATFYGDQSDFHDDGGYFEFALTNEEWEPASNDEIRQAAEASGADLTTYLKPEKGLL